MATDEFTDFNTLDHHKPVLSGRAFGSGSQLGRAQSFLRCRGPFTFSVLVHDLLYDLRPDLGSVAGFVFHSGRPTRRPLFGLRNVSRGRGNVGQLKEVLGTHTTAHPEPHFAVIALNLDLATSLLSPLQQQGLPETPTGPTRPTCHPPKTPGQCDHSRHKTDVLETKHIQKKRQR